MCACSLLIIVVVKFLFDFFCFIGVENRVIANFKVQNKVMYIILTLFILISLLLSLVSLQSLYINFLYITFITICVYFNIIY